MHSHFWGRRLGEAGAGDAEGFPFPEGANAVRAKRGRGTNVGNNHRAAAYNYTSGKRTVETYTLTPPQGALPMESTFKLDEILLKPFHLTKKHHIPNDICEKLLLKGFCMLISWFIRTPSLYPTLVGVSPYINHASYH